MSARDRILSNLQKSALPAARVQLPVVPADTSTRSRSDLVADLIRNLESAHGEVHRVTPTQLDAAIDDFCKRRTIRSLLLPAGDLPFLPERLQAADAPQHMRIERFDQAVETIKEKLFLDTDAGLTLADCAIADTGLLVQVASPTQPRTLSLVPPIHLCVLDTRRIYPSLLAAMAKENWSGRMPSNLIFISGPSKTADIQQTLAYGAHGPKELVVFLLEEAQS